MLVARKRMGWLHLQWRRRWWWTRRSCLEAGGLAEIPSPSFR
uniref:Uncharacterized protein n=1 Tax=Rhizophora mucronata TaxID=61149 RepID=A0A2P2P2Z2_RHIMU